jgi:lipid-binding SYLF domain-containing protein
MKIVLALLVTVLFIPLPVKAQKTEKEDERLAQCGEVMKEIVNIPDNIPQDLLDKAECVVVIPSVKKLAFGFSGSYGRGAMVCRTGENFTGPWSAPAMYRLEGGGFGLQLGGQETDFVLLVMNHRGVESLLRSKVKLGADAAAAAGPKGRVATGATDVALRAEILSYSRNRGLFAGVSLEGSTLREDNEPNKKIYGRDITAREILRRGSVHVPSSAKLLVSLLNKRSPKNHSDPKSLGK